MIFIDLRTSCDGEAWRERVRSKELWIHYEYVNFETPVWGYQVES